MINNSLLTKVISVIVIEDIAEIRNNLREFISVQPNLICSSAFSSVEEFLAYKDFEFPPDVILLDIGLPGISGINGIKLIKERFPGTDIMMQTVYDDHNNIFHALCEGATGYLVKNTPLPKIATAIVELYNGGAPMSPQIARKVIQNFGSRAKPDKEILTEKEKIIVQSLVDGQSYKMIANNLGNSIDTIRHHIKNIYKKLQVNSKGEVIAKSLKGEI